MKRLLERDDDDDIAKKRAKMATPEGQLINKLLAKWAMVDDKIARYVLTDICDLEELKFLDTTNYQPDKHHWQKSAPDLLARYVNDCRERKMPGGSALDVVATFKARWKLDPVKDKKLRSLNHKELRYVLNNYDGSKPFDEVC